MTRREKRRYAQEQRADLRSNIILMIMAVLLVGVMIAPLMMMAWNMPS